MSTSCHCNLLRLATRKVSARYDAALAPLGINIAQYSLLRKIERHQPVSLTALGKLTELDRSTIGRNVRVVERLGLVATSRGEDDQREAVVALTPAGGELLAQAVPRWQECQAELEAKVGTASLDALSQIVAAV
ncbi:MarR family transcriptional regulator [Ancylobacter sp. A5.8]|uniref:MarR family winged helix-turn-helix transcriptional regulator n=1 Tax=Ancylobacter gelatini TaxID=2919920 RepID=UPI001F4DA2FA|nr:MarR family transcriptional regulator [Ancylobacter gelatini]MCJ8144218.1 MarR family transcriptional regulator [Ancylobacter gelatini]